MSGFKMKILRSNLIMGLLLFFYSNCLSQVDSIKKKDSPILSFENENHDFGTIKKGEVITYNYKFTNLGNIPLIITDVNTGCDCTTAEWPKDSIKKGEIYFIKITYKSEEEGGDQAKEIIISSNSITPKKTIRFTGYVDYSGK